MQPQTDRMRRQCSERCQRSRYCQLPFSKRLLAKLSDNSNSASPALPNLPLKSRSTSDAPIGEKLNSAADGTVRHSAKRQSPVDFSKLESTFDSMLQNAKFQFDYVPSECTLLLNTGSTWQLTLMPGSTSALKVSFLPDKYALAQAHAHWGTSSQNGSEHTIDGRGFAAEIHIVHLNSKYSAEEAGNQPDGILVLGILVEEGRYNPILDPIVQLMHKVKYKTDSCELDSPFDLRTLLPGNLTEFWTYDGSLTTPPYSEAVTWVVFKETITASRDQINKFHQLFNAAKDDAAKHIMDNSRVAQPLSGRVLKSSFPHD